MRTIAHLNELAEFSKPTFGVCLNGHGTKEQVGRRGLGAATEGVEKLFFPPSSVD